MATTESKSPTINLKGWWQPLIAIGIIVLIVVMAQKSCKPPVQVALPDTKHILDSVALAKSLDSLQHQRETDSLATEIAFKDMEREMLSNQLSSDGQRIEQLRRLIALNRRDTIRLIEDCDSLSAVFGPYKNTADSLTRVYADLNTAYRLSNKLNEDAIADLDRAYLAVVDAAVKEMEANEKYRKQNKPRGTLSIGPSVLWSPATYGAGASLMLKDKRDRVYHGGYYITDGKPLYQAGVAFKISFRK